MKSLVALFLLIPVFVCAAVQPPQKQDHDYTAKIKQHTTSPEFLTDLVDHLPASDTVPTPQKFLGYVAGSPDRLTYSEDVYRYMRALEAASSRLKVFSIGKTEEGREMILVVIGDESTIANLNRYKEVTAQLSDPRKLSDQQAAELIRQGKPMYYATGAMHSPETGSPEMLMELAYRLIVEETPMIQRIRKNIITMITPILEVDGRNRMVDTVRWYQQNKDAGMPPLMYWGKYVAHDNNRDTMGLALNLTKNVLNTFWEWHPQVMHDLHESIPFLYVSTGTGPYNAWLDPVAINEWQRMAYHEVQVLTGKGLPGVWTHGFYDGWAPNYMFWIAHGHNAIGRFYETFGNAVPETQDRVVRNSSERAWYRPNPPYPKVKWSLRNNVNYQQSGLLLALDYMAQDPQHFLQIYWTLGKRAVAKPKNEGPAAYVFNANQKRKGQLRDLLNLLRTHGIEVHRADRAFTIKQQWPPKKKEDQGGKKEEEKKESDKKKEPEEINFSAGSFIVRMDQPYSRMADTLLDIQYVRGEERVYDDTGWTLPYTKNVEVKRIVNTEVLQVAMRPWDGKWPNGNGNPNGKTLVVKNVADTDLVRLRWAIKDAKFSVLEQEIKSDKTTWPAGTIIIRPDGNSSNVAQALQNVNAEYRSIDLPGSARTREIGLSRIAIMHTWLDTQDEGWFRLAFESLGVPYDYISTQDAAKESNLRARYDVIIFPPIGGISSHDIVNGLPAGPALPWKKTSLTPNLGVDETEDMRPGLGIGGVQNLKSFVEQGGLLITVRDTARWAVEYGLARWVTVVEPKNLKARGTIVGATVTDKNSPVAWGYDETVPVHYAGAPIFKVGTFFDSDDDEDEHGAQRPSGRGSKTDPDIPQGRRFVEMPEKPKPGPGEQGFQLPEDQQFFYKPYLPRVEERPRVILSFPKEADKILLSGMLEGADEIKGKPILIDSPLGKGHILLFASNPMWRMNTQGNFAFVFNAIMHYQNLSLGWPPAKTKDSN